PRGHLTMECPPFLVRITDHPVQRRCRKLPAAERNRWGSKLLLGLLTLLICCGCERPRPSTEAAAQSFSQRFPNVQIVSIEKPLDEVISRDFKVRYQKSGANREGEIEIEFIWKDDSKTWEPMMPGELP